MPKILSKTKLVSSIKENCQKLREDGGIGLCCAIGRHIHQYCELDGGYGASSIKKLHKLIGRIYSLASLQLFRGFYRDWPKQMRTKAITADLKYRYLCHFSPLIRLLNNMESAKIPEVSNVEQSIVSLIEESGKKEVNVTGMPERIEEFLLTNYPEALGQKWIKNIAVKRRAKVKSLLINLKLASKKLAAVDGNFDLGAFMDSLGRAGKSL